MNKKGFTLIELLAVIGLLALIVSIAIGAFSGINNNSLESIVEEKIKSFEGGAIFYGQEHPNELTDSCEIDGVEYKCREITFGELLDKNYAESNEEVKNGKKDIFNNKSGNSMRCDTIIIYRKNNRVYAKIDKINSEDKECNE